MAIERRKYTEEFKREAVRLMETSGKPIAELARDLGINDITCIAGAGCMAARYQ